jgi:outer membrane protein assembly factor BamE
MQKLLISLITFASLSISACSIDQFRVYKIDVQQGNALEQEDVDRIKTGMNKRQVEFLLGSPMLIDPFREDRWDYVFYFKPGYGKPEKARLTLWFDGDQITRIEQDGTFEMPAQIMKEAKGRQ